MISQEVSGRMADWLVGQGVMAERIRSLDWSTTPLGPRTYWGQPLRTVVNLAVNSKLPMILIWGEQQTMICNDAAQAMLVPKGNCLGGGSCELRPEVWSHVHPRLATVMQRGESFFLDNLHFLALREGQTVDTRFTAAGSPVHDDDGSIGGALVMFQEMTAAAEYRQKLDARQAPVNVDETTRLAEEKYRGIISTSADAIVTIDADQTIIEWNDGARDTFGYEQAEIIGKPLSVLIPVRHRENHGKNVAKFAHENGRKARKMDHMIACGLRKSGEEFPVSATISRLRIGNQLLMTAVARDISDEKRQENDLRMLADCGAALASLHDDNALQEVVQLLVRSMGDSVALYVVEGARSDKIRVIAAGDLEPDGGRKHGIVSSELFCPDRSHPIWKIIEKHESVLVDPTAELYAALDDTPPFRQLLQGIHPRSILGIPVSVSDRCVGVLRIASKSRVFDMQYRQLMEEVGRRCALFIENARLHEANRVAIRARDEVLGVVAHDLRNPLGVILLETAILAKINESENERSSRAATVIERCARRIHRILDDLRDVVQFESGHLSMDLSLHAPARLIADVVEVQAPLLTHASLDMKLDVAPNLPDVNVDRDRLLQVFENLIGNAVKFSKAGQCIEIGADRVDDEIVFWVQDQGAGIRAEDLPHVFERFWHGDTRKGGGTGLGLTIVKDIIEMHRGHVHIDSTPHVETRFSFTIPIMHPANTAA